MVQRLRIDPTAAEPIWHQIENGVRRLVASQSLARGAIVPSVRELAEQLGVNPATVAKAYRRLRDADVLTVRRGEGTYVSDTAPKQSKAERGRELREAAEHFVTVALTLGASRGEARDELAAAWNRLAPS